jgi:hypothetical protein
MTRSKHACRPARHPGLAATVPSEAAALFGETDGDTVTS